jgi:hypothetical protein
MTPTIEKLTAKIRELDTERASLFSQLEEELTSITAADIVGIPMAKASTSKPRKPAGERKPRADGLPAKLLAVINASYPDTWTADQLIGNLKIELDKAQQVRTTLSRLLKQSKITSPTSGKYRAVADKVAE